MKINLDVVTGFLGSGKSTLINSIIKETIVKGDEVLVIQLEDGETKIIDELSNVKKCIYNGEVYELDSFMNEKIRESNFSKIIIEYNGTESFDELKDILSKESIRRKFKINDIYFVADAKNIKSYILNMSDLIVPSLESSDLILINNCFNIEDKTIIDIDTLIKTINLSGHILKCANNENMATTIRESKLFKKRTIKRLYMNIRGNRN